MENKKTAIIGTPCHMTAAAKMDMFTEYLGESTLDIKIGLFCMENFSYKSMQTLIEDHAGQALPSVKKVEIGKGKYWVYTTRGNVVTLPLKVTHKYEQPGCHVCLDYVSNLGDISTGSVGSPDGWSTVFVRTKQGEAVWNKAVASGMFETKAIEPGSEKPPLGLKGVGALAKEKIDKNRKRLEARKTFGVNKALRDYTA